MPNRPSPPYLVIRTGLAFWVETRPTDDCSARLQAFEEGCYRDAFCFDATGGLWPILDARLKRRPSFMDRLFGISWIPVELMLGQRRDAAVSEIVSHLADVLQNPEFTEYSRTPPDILLGRLQRTRSPEELIDAAREPAA